MAQLAYIAEGETFEEASEVPAPKLSVSLFADCDGTLEVLAEDAGAAGLSVRGKASLASVVEGSGSVLGDIVLVECGTVTGEQMVSLSRLDERAARSGAELIVSTSNDALEAVFFCLDRSGAQILVGASRAERLVALGQALTRMRGNKVCEMDESDRHAIVRLSEEVGRLARRIEGLSGSPADSSSEEITVHVASPTLGFAHAEREHTLVRKPRPPLPDPRLVQRIIRQRERRREFFDGDLFADPAWDILLDLTAARAEHRRVSVTSLCIAANVPATTALRWISQMVETGLLERIQDDTDRRRAFIALSDKSADAMARYFDTLDGIGALAL